MSIRLQNEVNELRRQIEKLAAEVAAIQALLTAMTRQSTPQPQRKQA